MYGKQYRYMSSDATRSLFPHRCISEKVVRGGTLQHRGLPSCIQCRPPSYPAELLDQDEGCRLTKRSLLKHARRTKPKGGASWSHALPMCSAVERPSNTAAKAGSPGRVAGAGSTMWAPSPSRFRRSAQENRQPVPASHKVTAALCKLAVT